jgi:hypothetical protein
LSIGGHKKIATESGTIVAKELLQLLFNIFISNNRQQTICHFDLNFILEQGLINKDISKKLVLRYDNRKRKYFHTHRKHFPNHQEIPVFGQ